MGLDQAVPMLRAELDRIRSKAADPVDRNLDQIAASKRRVIGHDGPVFAPGGVGQLDRDTFLEFLRIENNEHRSGINRSGAQIASDMPRPRRAPALLVDEQVPPRQRLDQLYPRGGPATVGYLGPAILTPILQVAYPDEYGVRNGITEAGMHQVGAWPLPPTSASFAEQYESIDGILLRLAAEPEIDLWTLDSLWWKRTSRRAKGPATGSWHCGCRP